MKARRAVIFMGFNNPRKHKRGVENVIFVQSRALPEARKFYLFFDSEASVARWGGTACIGIKRGRLRMLRLNLLLLVLMWRLRKFSVVLHSHNYLMSLCSFRRTDMFSVHDGLFYQMSSCGRSFPRAFQWVERTVYRRCRFVHFNSEFTRRRSEFQGGRPYSVIHCSTHLESYAPTAPSPVDSQQDLLLVAVRSMEERARIDLLLDVAERLKQSHPKARFIVAGKGPLLDHYRAEATRRDLHNIELLGFVDDARVANLYRSAHLVLMTCEYAEGFGLPVIEAWLFNRPAIASNRCAVPEVMQDERFLFENDPESVCKKIEEALMLSAAIDFRAIYDHRFSQQVIVRQFRELYDAAFQSKSLQALEPASYKEVERPNC